MYNKASLKAEEFICHEEIEETLAYAEANKDNLALIDEIIAKAKLRKGLTHREASVLLACENEEKIQEVYDLAEQIKKDFYGNRIVMFAPLYLSNYCINGCVYCPYHGKNKHIARKKLTQDEVRQEVTALQDMGHKRLAIEAGEDPVNNPIEYILECIKTIYSIKHKNGAIRRVNVNIAATTVENYRKLKEAGIGTYILFQETYHKESYEKLHPTGPKHDYAYHTEAMDRAMEGGIDDVGLGVLFGLGALYAFTSLLLTIAYLYIPSGVATTIHFLYPLLVAAIMALFFKDRISVSVMVAALAAVAGVWLLSGGTDAAVGMKGLTLALATVATYAVYIVGVNKSCVQHMKGLKMVFFILLSATIIFAGNLFVKGEIPESIPDWSAAVHLILLALIPTLVSDLTLVLAVQRIGSTTTAILGCLEPLTAVALGIFFLGERFVAEQFAGVALIVAAVVTVILGGRPGRFSVRRLIPDFLSNFYKAR